MQKSNAKKMGLLGLVSLLLPGCIWVPVAVIVIVKITIIIVWAKATFPTNDDRWAMALVVKNTTVVSNCTLEVDTGSGFTPVPTDTSVSAPHQALLSGFLQGKDKYNPATDSIFYYQTTGFLHAQQNYQYRTKCDVQSNSPNGIQLGDTIRMAGTSHTDLNNGLPLTQIGYSEQALVQPSHVPAVSTWGMLVMLLLLSTAGTIVALRRRAAVA